MNLYLQKKSPVQLVSTPQASRMSLNPLTLECLAMRKFIQERGVEGCNRHLTPSMRQELLQISCLTGTWEVVDQQVQVRREDGGVVSSQDEERLRAKMQGLTSDLSFRGHISVSCNIGPVWRVDIQGKKHFEISLMRTTRQFPNIAILQGMH